MRQFEHPQPYGGVIVGVNMLPRIVELLSCPVVRHLRGISVPLLPLNLCGIFVTDTQVVEPYSVVLVLFALRVHFFVSGEIPIVRCMPKEKSTLFQSLLYQVKLSQEILFVLFPRYWLLKGLW